MNHYTSYDLLNGNKKSCGRKVEGNIEKRVRAKRKTLERRKSHPYSKRDNTKTERKKKLDEKKNQKEEFSIGPAGEKKREKTITSVINHELFITGPFICRDL